VATVVALAQDVPPPPKPADDGPSLEVTMKFIEEKLGSIGPVNWIEYIHDETAGSDWRNRFSSEATSVKASAAGCRIDYHWQLTRGAHVTRYGDYGFPLKIVQEVVVKTAEQLFKESGSKAGHPEWTSRVDPPVFFLSIKSKGGGLNGFYLYDETLANRIAKTLVRAVELCGGATGTHSDDHAVTK